MGYEIGFVLYRDVSCNIYKWQDILRLPQIEIELKCEYVDLKVTSTSVRFCVCAVPLLVYENSIQTVENNKYEDNKGDQDTISQVKWWWK